MTGQLVTRSNTFLISSWEFADHRMSFLFTLGWFGQRRVCLCLFEKPVLNFHFQVTTNTREIHQIYLYFISRKEHLICSRKEGP